MVLRTGSIHGHPGVQPPFTSRPEYATYKSPHGPNYKVDPHFRGINQRILSVIGKSGGLFAVTAGVGLLYMASDIPKVRIDIMEKLPYIGEHFKKEIPPDENPF